MVLDNCILAGGGIRYNTTPNPPYPFRGNSLELRRITAVTAALLDLPIEYPLPAGPVPPGLAVHTANCVLDVSANLFAFELSRQDVPTPQEAGERLKQLVSWTDQGGLFPPGRLLTARGKATSVTLPDEPKTVGQWRTFWKMPDAKLLTGRPRFAGGDVRARQSGNVEAVVADDFRLRPDSPGQGQGADVDLVGPGLAYERWQKSKDHLAWRKQSDELLARPPIVKPVQPIPLDYPFVILARDGRRELRQRTLAAAVRAARDGDVIEVRGDGPFPCAPVRIPRALTIRAAEGYRPVFRRASSLPGALLSTTSPLVLEGLALEGLSSGKESERHGSLVYSGQAPLWLANCRFTTNYPADRTIRAVVANGSPRVEVRNCRFSVPNWAALSWIPPPTGRLVLGNNLLRPGTVLVNLNPTALAALELDLAHNTWITPTMALEWRLASPARAKTAGAVKVRAEGNVFAANGSAFFFNQDQKAPVAAAVSEGQARHLLKWDLHRNLYREGKPLFTFGQQWKALPGARSIKGLAEWKEFWGQPQSDALQVKIDLHGDFRIKPGSPGKGLGANIDLLGPGLAYERWKKMPGYAEWQQGARAILGGKKPK
jgi:hypothetical protein